MFPEEFFNYFLDKDYANWVSRDYPPSWHIAEYSTLRARLQIVQEEVLLSPVELRDWLIASNTTRCFFTTVIAEELISLDWPQDVALKTMLVGGDQLQLQPPSPLPFDYVNVYGPTECTVISTAGGVSPRKGENVAPHIGRPLANTDLYVLGPIGVPGELYIGGDGVALGYLKQPKLTAEKFIPHPFKEGERLFRTGDLVRYRSDGNLEFLGRIDDQVKIRGFRIELGEIGVVIMGHSNVQAAVATVREDVPGRKRLVAYVVPAEGETLQIPELREYVKQKLPDYMVPVAWVMDALPLTPNEKVYRKELPSPDWTQTGQEESYVAPRIPVEKILAEVWSEVLGVEKVGIHDDFFERGGDSILAIQIVYRANERGLFLKTQQIFFHPTIAELASVVKTAPDKQAEQGVVTGDVSLTPIQHWFFEQNLPHIHHWNQYWRLKNH